MFGKTLKMSVFVHELSKSTKYACPAQMSTVLSMYKFHSKAYKNIHRYLL